ncbi:MAG: DUF2141 domain-containing protein [Deltaproteobacteria bacterium]
MLNTLLITFLISALPDAAVVRFTVEVPSDRGQVLCAAFDTASTWLTEDVVTGAVARVKNGKAVCELRGLPPGRYAISAFHDEDNDGELDTNLLGIPTEAFCASRGARASFGPPSFDDAVFDFAGGTLELSARAE